MNRGDGTGTACGTRPWADVLSLLNVRDRRINCKRCLDWTRSAQASQERAARWAAEAVAIAAIDAAEAEAEAATLAGMTSGSADAEGPRVNGQLAEEHEASHDSAEAPGAGDVAEETAAWAAAVAQAADAAASDTAGVAAAGAVVRAAE